MHWFDVHESSFYYGGLPLYSILGRLLFGASPFGSSINSPPDLLVSGRYDGAWTTTTNPLDGYLSFLFFCGPRFYASSFIRQQSRPSSYSYVIADRQRMSPIYRSVLISSPPTGIGVVVVARRRRQGPRNSTFSCKDGRILCCSLIRRSRSSRFRPHPFYSIFALKMWPTNVFSGAQN